MVTIFLNSIPSIIWAFLYTGLILIPLSIAGYIKQPFSNKQRCLLAFFGGPIFWAVNIAVFLFYYFKKQFGPTIKIMWDSLGDKNE